MSEWKWTLRKTGNRWRPWVLRRPGGKIYNTYFEFETAFIRLKELQKST